MNQSIVCSKFAAVAVLATLACDGLLLVEDPPGTLWEGNAEECPGEIPLGEPDCSIAEGQICLYETPDPLNPGSVVRSLCGCWETSADERRFHCYESGTSSYECPSAEPAHGSSCVGMHDASCSYPERTSCRCVEGTDTWECIETGGLVRDDPPASVDPNKPINTLTPDERAEWCDWFGTARLGEDYPEDPPPEVDENGYTMNTGCTYGRGFMCEAAIPSIPSTTCQANLALSECEAPISELSDCVMTTHDFCWPAPHGCARYFDRPGCDGTVIRHHPEGSSGSGGTGGIGATSGAGATDGTGTGGTGGTIANCSIRVQ